MKKSPKFKGLVAVLALVVVISATIGGTYMWFFNQNDGMTGSGNAAKINLESTTAGITFAKVLPGEPVDLGSNSIEYDGNRYAILRVALTDATTAKLKYAPDSNLTDYDEVTPGNWVYTQKRLDEIMNVNINPIIGGSSTITFYNKGNIWYALVGENEAGIDIVGGIEVKFTGEFGGGYQGSVSRQFEQESEFAGLGLVASVVQCTEEAVEDVWGITVADLPAGLLADIAGTPDAAESWDYVG